MAKQIKWESIWKKFDRWFDSMSGGGSWEEQRKKIETLINNQIKKKK